MDVNYFCKKYGISINSLRHALICLNMENSTNSKVIFTEEQINKILNLYENRKETERQKSIKRLNIVEQFLTKQNTTKEIADRLNVSFFFASVTITNFLNTRTVTVQSKL